MNETPYWWTTVHEATVGSRESAVKPLPAKVDVAIVGAGYTGLSAARYLANRGASVVVLEREQAGWGASSRNGGQVITGLRLDPMTLVANYGEEQARRLFDASIEAMERLETLIASERIDCRYERSGHLVAAARPSHFAHLQQAQQILSKVFRHPVHVLSKSEQRAELGSAAYHGVLVDERSAHLNPVKYVKGLEASALQAGAAIVSGTGVEQVTRRGREGWTLITGRGPIEATDLLMATNGYTDKALPALRRRLIPVGSYIIATAPLDRQVAQSILPKSRVAFDSLHFLHYFRLTDDGRLLFGGRAEFSEPGHETTRRAARILREDMVTIFPELLNVEVEFGWGGNVAMTRDEMPHAGRLDGAYYAGGYCGHGIAMATWLGELIARRIAGDAVDHPFVDDRFPAIPLYNGRPWFLPLAGVYYKVLDYVS